jgi:GNAT superfamily N-acetyltransferase
MKLTALSDLIITRSPARTWTLPEWTTFEGTDEKYGDVYQAVLGSRLLAYAIFEVDDRGFQESDCVVKLVWFETHPAFEGEGIGSYLLQKALSNYPNSNIILESIIDEAVYGFYCKNGFVAFARDGGTEQMMLIRPAPNKDSDLALLFSNFYQSDECEETWYDFLAGCVWDRNEKRWIRPNRDYEAEKAAVVEEPWEIETVQEQTSELQRIALEREPGVIWKIKEPDPTITNRLKDELVPHVCPCTCPSSQPNHSIYSLCPNFGR